MFSLTAVHLAGPRPAHRAVSLGRLLEHGEGAEILGVVTIRDPGQRVVIPVEETSLDSGLEPREDLLIPQLSWLCASLTASTALVGLNLKEISFLSQN